MNYLISTLHKLGIPFILEPVIIKDTYGKFPSNISICIHNGELMESIRLTDYIYHPIHNNDICKYIVNKYPCNSITIIQSKDDKNIISPIKTQLNHPSFGQFTGYEDIRLASWNNILYSFGSLAGLPGGIIEPTIIKYNDLQPKHITIFHTGNNEKNWMPITDRPFQFMYDPLSCSIMDLSKSKFSSKPPDEYKVNIIKPHDFSGKISGSTQLIPIEIDGQKKYIGICHKRYQWLDEAKFQHIHYEHYFITYDEDLKEPILSQPFQFIINGIEFCCGLCEYNDNIIISFSIIDGLPHKLIIPKNDFLNFLKTNTFSQIPISDNFLKEHFGKIYKESSISQRIQCIPFIDSDIINPEDFIDEQNILPKGILRKILIDKYLKTSNIQKLKQII